MATLDDKLLGEKTHYYCSSSSDEDDDASDGSPNRDEPSATFIPSCELNEWAGSSTNTGPKGVIKDWQRYKQLEAEKREEQEQERLALMKKLSLTCNSVNDDEKLKQQEEKLECELEELLDDQILEEFKKLHMKEMMELHCKKKYYGAVLKLKDGQEFLDVVDNTEKSTTVIIYIYSDREKYCQLIHECMKTLAEEYSEVRFCCVEACAAGLSTHFKRSGVPALLVYKSGTLVGNFIRITDELGDGFVTSDIENYLLEHGMLPDRSLSFSSIHNPKDDDCSD